LRLGVSLFDEGRNRKGGFPHLRTLPSGRTSLDSNRRFG
jgi:hypothetical protein